MNLLLDTHIWIWTLNRPDRLSRAVKRQIENPKNEIYLSPVSIWEASHVARRGNLVVKDGFADWLNQALARVPVRQAPISFAVAAEVSRLNLPQADFGDLFLAATCIVHDLTLVTADTQLIECSWLKTLPN